jgi:hypothetical protein
MHDHFDSAAGFAAEWLGCFTQPAVEEFADGGDLGHVGISDGAWGAKAGEVAELTDGIDTVTTGQLLNGAARLVGDARSSCHG